VFVLFRHLPITLTSVGDTVHSHCTVQAEFDYQFSLISDGICQNGDALCLPFVIPPCPENELIKKDLFQIVADMGVSREHNSLSSSILLLDIMRRIDLVAGRGDSVDDKSASSICHAVKKYVAGHINEKISLAQIADSLQLSPGYINHTFKKSQGVPVVQYINGEKVKRVSELMIGRNMPFARACDSVGISDCSYGYRLFKKHMGITPGRFRDGDLHSV